MRITEMTRHVSTGLYEGLDPTFVRTARLWETAGRFIVEAKLSDEQVDKLFKAVVSAGPTGASDPTEKPGVKQAVRAAWDDLKAKSDLPGHIKGIEQKLETVVSKLEKSSGNDPKLSALADRYTAFAKQYPAAQGVIYSALVAAAGISAAGLGVGAALGLLSLSDQLIRAKAQQAENPVSESQVNRVLRTVVNEGAMDFIKNLYQKAKEMGRSPTQKLKDEWTKAGSPKKPKAIKRFLKAQGVTDDVIVKAFKTAIGGGSETTGSEKDTGGKQDAMSKMASQLSGGAEQKVGSDAFGKMASTLSGDDTRDPGAKAFGKMSSDLGGDADQSPGAGAFGNMASSLSAGKKPGKKPHPGISQGELRRRWIQFMRSNGIADVKSATSGKVGYHRQPTDGDVESFLNSEGEYTENEIQSAIRHVSGTTRLKTTMQQRAAKPAQPTTKGPTTTTTTQTEPKAGAKRQPPAAGADQLKANIAAKAGPNKTVQPPTAQNKPPSGIDQLKANIASKAAAKPARAQRQPQPETERMAKADVKTGANPQGKLAPADLRRLKADMKRRAVSEEIRDKHSTPLTDQQIEQIFKILIATRY